MTTEIFNKEGGIKEEFRRFSYPFRAIKEHRNKKGFFINTFDISYATKELRKSFLNKTVQKRVEKNA